MASILQAVRNLLGRATVARLGGYPGDRITVACRACERREVYSLADVIARFGPDTPLDNPALLAALSAHCPTAAHGNPCPVVLMEPIFETAEASF